MLIRFDTTSPRLPTASLFQGLVDWTRGSNMQAMGTVDHDDYKPFSSSPGGESGSSGHAISGTAFKKRTGFARISATAGSNANTEYARNSFFDVSKTPQIATERSFIMNATANTPKLFVGFSDVAVGSILAAAVLANGSSQNSIGLLWNGNTKKLDLVSVVNGTAKTLKTDIGTSLDPADTSLQLDASGVSQNKLGVRLDKLGVDSSAKNLYRVTPCVNGTIIRGGCVTVNSDFVPEVPMSPCIAHTVSATTAPSVDMDWELTLDR